MRVPVPQVSSRAAWGHKISLHVARHPLPLEGSGDDFWEITGSTLARPAPELFCVRPIQD